jgi:hypothetical protein
VRLLLHLRNLVRLLHLSRPALQRWLRHMNRLNARYLQCPGLSR